MFVIRERLYAHPVYTTYTHTYTHVWSAAPEKYKSGK
jgi:hypothetical protein